MFQYTRRVPWGQHIVELKIIWLWDPFVQRLVPRGNGAIPFGITAYEREIKEGSVVEMDCIRKISFLGREPVFLLPQRRPSNASLFNARSLK